jgi:hypothetical protein
VAGDVDGHQLREMVVKVDRFGTGLASLLVDAHAGFERLGHAPGEPARLGIIVERAERGEPVDRAAVLGPGHIEGLAHVGHQRMRRVFGIVGEVERRVLGARSVVPSAWAL